MIIQSNTKNIKNSASSHHIDQATNMIPNWGEIIKSKEAVRTSDQQSCGNIIAESADNITISQGALNNNLLLSTFKISSNNFSQIGSLHTGNRE